MGAWLLCVATVGRPHCYNIYYTYLLMSNTRPSLVIRNIRLILTAFSKGSLACLSALSDGSLILLKSKISLSACLLVPSNWCLMVFFPYPSGDFSCGWFYHNSQTITTTHPTVSAFALLLRAPAAPRRFFPEFPLKREFLRFSIFLDGEEPRNRRGDNPQTGH